MTVKYFNQLNANDNNKHHDAGLLQTNARLGRSPLREIISMSIIEEKFFVVFPMTFESND